MTGNPDTSDPRDESGDETASPNGAVSDSSNAPATPDGGSGGEHEDVPQTHGEANGGESGPSNDSANGASDSPPNASPTHAADARPGLGGRSGSAVPILTCPFCNAVFAVPGFDDEQIAGVLTAHIAANHLQEAGTIAAEALPKDLKGTITGNVPEEAATDPAEPSTQPTDAGAIEPASETTPGAATNTDSGQNTPAKEPTRDPTDTAVTDTTNRGPGHDTGRTAGNAAKRPVVDEDLLRNRPNNPAAGTKDQDRGTPGKTPRPPQEGLGANGAGTAPASPESRRGEDGSTRSDDQQDGSRLRNLSEKIRKNLGKPPPSLARAATDLAGKGVDTVKKIGNTAEQAATKGLQAAGSSVGIPPVVTRIAIKVAKRGLPLFLAFAVAVTAAIFGGTLDGDAPEDRVYEVPLSEQLDIPDPYLDAYVNAARAQKIPWTLLAAIGANATYHGRIDPYKQEVPLPAAQVVESDEAKRIVVLTDATLAASATYLGAFLAPEGYTVDVVPLGDVGIENGTEWLEENGLDGARKLVVALGSNETVDRQQFADKVDRLVNTPGPYYPVVWVNLDGTDSGPYNEVLREKDSRRQNLRVVDWAGTVAARSFTADDTGNYNDEAQRTRAGLIAATITGNAVSGGLPVSAELTGPGVLPTPTGDCPALSVPVAGETPAQGAGPLMLVPAALAAAGYELGDDVQNICAAADVLAEILAETARSVADEEGTTFPRGVANLAQLAGGGDSDAAKQVHDFWAKVVDRAGVLGTVTERTCTFPEQGSLDDQAYVGNAIDSYWRCSLANVELFSVDAVTVDAAGNFSYRTLNQAEAVSRGVDEALGVAWNWSAWGTAECDDDALHAGVFPLTAAVFSRYAEDPSAGRCDAKQNILAAAEAFIVGESAALETRRGRWDTSIGGWNLVGPVSGPVGADLFDTLGPWQPLTVTTDCSRDFVASALAAARDAAFLPGMTAAQAQELAYAGVTDEFDTTGTRTGGSYPNETEFLAAVSGLDERLDLIVEETRNRPACFQERSYADEEWLGVLAGAINGDAITSSGEGDENLTIPARTTGRLDVPASDGDRALMIAGRAFSRVSAYAGVAPETGAYVQRLSSVRVALLPRPGVQSEEGDLTLSVGYRLINIAVGYYGGIFVGNAGETLTGFGFLDDTIPYHEEFNDVGQEYGIDPRILAAVAKQESNFDPEAGCPTEGAFGMMQKEFDTTPTLCGDVRRQVATAAEMLLELYQRAGDWKGALWGYNNGARFADAWTEFNGDTDAAEEYAYAWYRGQGTCPASGECPRAEIAMEYVSETPGDRSAMLTWLEYQRLFPSSVFSTRQTAVNGNECPNLPPSSSIVGRTVLRDGAEQIGVRELCVEAVAAAPTPEAARAIIFAFNNLGATYSQDLRSTSRAFDCSSYVSRSYEAAGILMNTGGTHFATRHLFPHSGHSRPEWVVPVAVHAAKPGDLVFPSQGHVAMLLTRGFIIHTNATGDVSKVERGYANPLQTNRIVPEIAPRTGG